MMMEGSDNYENPHNLVKIIAEIACSHEGILDRFFDLIDIANNAKVDAIKVQMISRENYIVKNDPNYILSQSITFSDKEWDSIFYKLETTNKKIIVLPTEIDSLKRALLYDIDALYINIHQIDDPFMLSAAKSASLPLFVSVGALTFSEIDKLLFDLGYQDGKSDIVLMYGMQNFPTRITDNNLRSILQLKDRYNLPIGFADHTDAFLEIKNDISILALGMQSSYIEKHFTIGREERGIDHQSALNPDELIKFVKRIRLIEGAFGLGVPTELSESQLEYRTFGSKKIVARKEIEQGKVIEFDDIIFKRTIHKGLSPDRYQEVIGKKALKKFSIDNLITQIDLKEV